MGVMGRKEKVEFYKDIFYLQFFRSLKKKEDKLEFRCFAPHFWFLFLFFFKISNEYKRHMIGYDSGIIVRGYGYGYGERQQEVLSRLQDYKDPIVERWACWTQGGFLVSFS